MKPTNKKHPLAKAFPTLYRQRKGAVTKRGRFTPAEANLEKAQRASSEMEGFLETAVQNADDISMADDTVSVDDIANTLQEWVDSIKEDIANATEHIQDIERQIENVRVKVVTSARIRASSRRAVTESRGRPLATAMRLNRRSSRWTSRTSC